MTPLRSPRIQWAAFAPEGNTSAYRISPLTTKAWNREPIISNIGLIMKEKPEIAVLIPCHNEEKTVGKVIEDFRAQLPGASIYVFDNCCSDRTAQIAAKCGACVILEPRIGKGFVVESMLDSIKADFYVLVDGDDTYPAERVHDLLNPLLAAKADMVVGARLSQYTDESFRTMHVFGNRLVRGLVNLIFRASLTDIMSGYRTFNSKVVQRIPIISSGFEVETELTIQMLYYKLKIIEISIPYRERPQGSTSKLRTVPDGIRVLWKLFSLIRNFKPLTFFGSLGILGMLAAAISIIPIFLKNAGGGYTDKPDTSLLVISASLVLLSSGLIVLGILLHAINWRLKELHGVMVRRHD
jgi:glycosyltransferase involved in cell wall biosynthesis